MSNEPITQDAADDGPRVELQADHVDALVDAAADRSEVAFEGLRVASDDDGFSFESEAMERVGLDESELRDVASDHARVVSNWYVWEVAVDSPAHYRAFLRWIEGANDPDAGDIANARTVAERYAALADGVSREWGQLRITAELAGDGTRRYEIRHADEAGAPRDELETHDDPGDARRLVKFDADGRYRPLKTAPSLPTGWAFSELDARDCYETVEAIYPATVANWHRERQGKLDVGHWAETAERQTGIYDLVDELDADAVDDVAAACCNDSQCLKRREWEYDDETTLDADPGAGRFPCREPCSVVVAAARKWTMLEREEPQEYTFQLTPSEKEQLEELVDAVADDRVEDVREGDVGEGANRYRARYLREKLFDEDGNLCGVPTDRDDAVDDEH